MNLTWNAYSWQRVAAAKETAHLNSESPIGGVARQHTATSFSPKTGWANRKNTHGGVQGVGTGSTSIRLFAGETKRKIREHWGTRKVPESFQDRTWLPPEAAASALLWECDPFCVCFPDPSPLCPFYFTAGGQPNISPLWIFTFPKRLVN